MLTPFAFVVVALAGYRLTRLVVFDSLFGFNAESGSSMSRRLDVWSWAADGSVRPGVGGWFRDKVGNLLVCSYCVGVWLTVGCWALWVWGPSWARFGITAAAVAGVQALLSAADHRLQ